MNANDAKDFTLPELVDIAATAMRNARSAAEVLGARDKARVAYDAARLAARLAKAKQAYDDLMPNIFRAKGAALELEAQAKKRIAEEYDAAQERGEAAKQGRPTTKQKRSETPTLKELNLSKHEVAEAREIRDAEEAQPGIVHDTVQAMLDGGEEPTKAALREAVIAAASGEFKTKPKRKKKRKVTNPYYTGEASPEDKATMRMLSQCDWLLRDCQPFEKAIIERLDPKERPDEIESLTKMRDFLNRLIRGATKR